MSGAYMQRGITRRLLVTEVAAPYAQTSAVLRYDRDDPFAVEVVFEYDDEEVAWRFGRDLLHQGLREHAGIGDVRFWPEGDRLILALSSPDGSAWLSFDAAEVRRFLAATHRAVPRSRESADIDGLIEQLLGGA